MGTENQFSGLTYGDIGDIINIIPIARALGSMSLYAQNNPLCKPILTPARFGAIKPLMDASPYIERFEEYAGQPITHNMATFRDGGIPYGHSLARLHADWVNVQISEEPWLKVDPDPAFEGCVVINRSTRHHSASMNWRPILEHYQDDLVFLGLHDEWIQLQNETGLQFRRHHTNDLLECAKIIQASRALLGNQSSLLNVAIALGKKYLCETSLWSLDVIYDRPDSCYSLDGGVEDFQVEGYAPLNIKPQVPQREVDWLVSPPGGRWKLRGNDGIDRSALNAKTLLAETNKEEAIQGVRLSTLDNIADQLFAEYPTYSGASYSNHLYAQIAQARQIIRAKQSPRTINKHEDQDANKTETGTESIEPAGTIAGSERTTGVATVSARNTGSGTRRKNARKPK